MIQKGVIKFHLSMCSTIYSSINISFGTFLDMALIVLLKQQSIIVVYIAVGAIIRAPFPWESNPWKFNHWEFNRLSPIDLNIAFKFFFLNLKKSSKLEKNAKI